MSHLTRYTETDRLCLVSIYSLLNFSSAYRANLRSLKRSALFLTFPRHFQGQYEDAVKTCEMEKNIFSQDLDAAIHAISSHKESVTILLQKAHTSVSGIVEDVVCVA